MIVRMVVHTPKGQAKPTEKRLRLFLMPLLKRPNKTGYSDDSFYWEIETDYRGWVGIQKKANMFGVLAGGLADSRVFKGAAKKFGSTPEQLREVKEMLRDGTSIEIIKNATAEEVIEGNTTMWEKFKQKFKS